MSLPLCYYRRRIVNALGPTTLRAYPAGMGRVVAMFLFRLDLSQLRHIRKEKFCAWLDRHTLLLRGRIARALKNTPSAKSYTRKEYWGVARKALNIFLISACHQRVLCSSFRLRNIEKYMEVPLDSQTAKALRREAKKLDCSLPRWRGIKRLTPQIYKKYQEFAQAYAVGKKCTRAELDFIFYQYGAYDEEYDCTD